MRRPILLMIVYGAFLALVGITATAQAAMVSAHFSTATLQGIVGSDSATVRSLVNAHVRVSYLEGTGPTAVELADLERELAFLVERDEILHVELRLPDGTVVASNVRGLHASRPAVGEDFAAAAAGTPRATLVDLETSEAGKSDIGSGALLREYLPIKSGGEVRAIVAVWRDAEPILTRLEGVRRDVVIVTLTAALIAATLLYLIFRAAQARLTRQTLQLLESTRRDPLTGTLNHGALVAHLAEQVEQARQDETTIGIALVDIDNFRLLNDNHGHKAGDQALLAVVELLLGELPEGVVLGRYGPDEFLLIAPTSLVADLEPVVRRVRDALVDLSLQFEATERLPVTLSAGLCTYPEHGASVTVLLAKAAATLEEAKASGGDSIVVAGAAVEDEVRTTSSFDVLQGLVFAVDTKDRYTKRHSEDVARYGVFLAEQLGMDEEFVRSVHVAGLLHDIGKIGIPDPVLRKPGRLTTEEYEIVKQHVALGDMIVRELPDIDVVRAGIRHHHERWDGAGYLHRLAGEEIPLIARILAIGDTFSAMTTTRPYRKGFDIQEALRRLGDAAGTQLDEQLVTAFINGIETATNPPLPGETTTAAIWTPRRQVA